MSISVVQTATANSTGGSAYSGNFGSNVTGGNTVILVGSGYNASGTTMSASAPTLGGSSVPGASLMLEEKKTGAGTNLDISAWLLPAVTGGATGFGLTITNNALSGSAVGLIALEVAGLGAAPALDQSTGVNSTAGGAQTSFSSGTTGAIGNAPELIVGFCEQDQTTTGSPGAPWTAVNLNGAQNTTVVYQVVTGAGGTYSVSYTTSPAANYALGVVTVYSTSVAPPGPAYTASMSTM